MEFIHGVTMAVLLWSALAYSFAIFTTIDLLHGTPPTSTRDTLLCLLITATAPVSILFIMAYLTYNRRKGERYGPP